MILHCHASLSLPPSLSFKPQEVTVSQTTIYTHIKTYNSQMGNYIKNPTCILWVVLIILASNSSIIKSGNAMRPLSEYKEWLKEFEGPLLLESLQRGPVPPSSSSPCTNIPGGGGRCTLEVNFAAVHSPPPPPPPFHKESAN